jgi:hypothetical protein
LQFLELFEELQQFVWVKCLEARFVLSGGRTGQRRVVADHERCAVARLQDEFDGALVGAPPPRHVAHQRVVQAAGMQSTAPTLDPYRPWGGVGKQVGLDADDEPASFVRNLDTIGHGAAGQQPFGSGSGRAPGATRHVPQGREHEMGLLRAPRELFVAQRDAVVVEQHPGRGQVGNLDRLVEELDHVRLDDVRTLF